VGRAHIPSLFHALTFFRLDDFAIPTLVVELVVELAEILLRHSAGNKNR
jgi:hypothetical protein